MFLEGLFFPHVGEHSSLCPRLAGSQVYDPVYWDPFYTLAYGCNRLPRGPEAPATAIGCPRRIDPLELSYSMVTGFLLS